VGVIVELAKVVEAAMAVVAVLAAVGQQQGSGRAAVG